MASKWMAVLEDEQVKWIKEAVKKSGTNGSLVIREAINRVRQSDGGDFISSLANAKLKSRLEALDKEKKRLEAEEKRIKDALK